jgi:hypothetical protein
MPFRFAWICPLIASASASDTVDSWETLAENREATFNAFRPTTPRTPNLLAAVQSVPSVPLHPDAEARTGRGEALVAEHLLEENFLDCTRAFLKPHTLWLVHRDIFTYNGVESFLQLVVVHRNVLAVTNDVRRWPWRRQPGCHGDRTGWGDAFDHRQQLDHVGGVCEGVCSDGPFQPVQGTSRKLVGLVIEVGPLCNDPAGARELGLLRFGVVAQVDGLGLRPRFSTAPGERDEHVTGVSECPGEEG